MARSKVISQDLKISFFTTSEKENLWSDTDTTTEVDDDVSHEASENKEQGKFQSHWASLYTWLTYDKKTPRVSDDYMTGLLFRLITFAG
jgi:hypothetical protein